jgi:hypothetical protein
MTKTWKTRDSHKVEDPTKMKKIRKAWKTPTIHEVDYRNTELSGSMFGSDGFGYS